MRASVWADFLCPGQSASVHEKNVLPTVLVVIEKRDAGAERLGQVFASERAVIVLEGNAGFRGDIHQLEAGIGPECQAAQNQMQAEQ